MAQKNTHLNSSIIHFLVRSNIYSCQSAVHHRTNPHGPTHAAVGAIFKVSFCHMRVSLEGRDGADGGGVEGQGHLEECQREEPEHGGGSKDSDGVVSKLTDVPTSNIWKAASRQAARPSAQMSKKVTSETDSSSVIIRCFFCIIARQKKKTTNS